MTGNKVDERARFLAGQRPLRYNLKRWNRSELVKEVIMAKLTEEAKKAIGEIRPALVATASKAGKPNVSAKGSLRVLDDEHVVFADIASPRSVANIKENPQVAIICLNPQERKSCRIWGKGEVLDSGPVFDEISAAMDKMNMKVRNVVRIAVEEVETS